jgi:hypothetical protein
VKKRKMSVLEQFKLMSGLLGIIVAAVALGFTALQVAETYGWITFPSNAFVTTPVTTGAAGSQHNRMTATPAPDPMDIIRRAASQTAAELSSPMRVVEAAASATAAALTGVAPTATLLPNMQSWVPPAADGFLPRFTYDSTQWALVDASTLASLQTSGCTLRRAGGRALGPGWSTEASSLKAGNITFLTILAKYQGEPQFITYSAPNGAVFEIASASGFAKCEQDGESVLKSLTLN